MLSATMADFGPINIRALSTLGAIQNHIRPNGSSKRAAYAPRPNIVNKDNQDIGFSGVSP